MTTIKEKSPVVFESKKFIHKETGEIVTEVPIMQLSEYEEYYGTCNHCGYPIDKGGMCTAPLSVSD